MKRRLIAVLLILTILPVTLISWLWVVSVRSERDRSQQHFALISTERLKNIDFQIGDVFSRIEKELLQLPDNPGMEADAIRELTRNTPLLRQFFILDSTGTLKFPSEEIELSGLEKDFLSRTKEIGLQVGLFRKPGGEETGEMLSRGWYTWYLGEGINFIYWKTCEEPDTGETGIVGFELNRMAVISEIINALPDTVPDASGDFRIQLLDVSGSIVYQWGEGRGGEDLYESAAIPVSEPLGSWSLRYRAQPGSGSSSRGRLIPVFATLFLVIIFIVGLAVYLYRESTREIREAMQRVTFVNQVSHELKTPLTNIRMYAELMEEQIPEEAAKQKAYLSIITAESRRLSRLIGNVLTFAREQRNGVQYNPIEISADEVIMRVLENFAPSLETKGINVETDLHCGREALVDRDILEQVLSNLISNVEKYGADGKLLKVESKRDGENILLTVRDTGPGIPKNVREKVWKPFFRMSNKLTDGVSGTGIGLSIVRTLAKAHGGSAEIIPADRGTAVRVLFHAPEAAS